MCPCITPVAVPISAEVFENFPHALEAVGQLLGLQNGVREERRNAVIARPAVHARVRISLKELAAGLDGSERYGLRPGAVVEAGSFPSFARSGAAFPGGVGHQQRGLQDLKSSGDDFQHQSVTADSQGNHVAPHAKLTRNIDRQQKGPKPVFGVTLRRGQELSVKVHANVARSGSIERCHRRDFFQRKSLAEAVEHAFAGASGLRTPDILLGQGSVYARLERGRGNIQRRIEGNGLCGILGNILDRRFEG